MMTDSEELQRLYQRRFQGRLEYRNRVWRILIAQCFQAYVPLEAAVLDLGCGYGEFINNVRCTRKYAMDLNPAAAEHIAQPVQLLRQDCAAAWPLADDTLDVVFTSNFFEHLPNKQSLLATLIQARRCLKPGGKLIALGPNIKYLHGAYWDFWDHYLPLTELSLQEALATAGFEVQRCTARFLPYTMVNAPEYPDFLLKIYLRMPLLWRFFGKQFLLVAQKPQSKV